MESLLKSPFKSKTNGDYYEQGFYHSVSRIEPQEWFITSLNWFNKKAYDSGRKDGEDYLKTLPNGNKK